jgi:hypothetical protein
MAKNVLMALVATLIFAFVFPLIYPLVNGADGKTASVVISSVVFFIAMMAAFTLCSRNKK